LATRGRVHILDPQNVLIGDEFRSAHSKIAYVTTIQYKDYIKYKVLHETERKIRVRFEDRIQNSVIEQVEFDLFLAADGSHIFAATKDDLCDELLARLRNTHRDVEYHSREIDLKRVQKEGAQRISGAWFGKLQLADISAAAIFGTEVSESDEWDRYIELGILTSLQLDFSNGSSSYKVSISKKGGIVVFNNLEEEVRIELVDTISQSIEPYVIVKSGKAARGQKG
jgi:hypothetical protein